MTRRTRSLFAARDAAAALALAAVAAACNPLASSDVTGPSDNGPSDTGTDAPAIPTFASLYEGYFALCTDCHSPSGPGRTSETEGSLDFSTIQSAYDSLTKGKASAMVGNPEACNGVAFLGATYEESLVVATIDEAVRASFLATGQGTCDTAAVTDMTLKVQDQAAPSPAFLRDLKAWIDAGAPE